MQDLSKLVALDTRQKILELLEDEEWPVKIFLPHEVWSQWRETFDAPMGPNLGAPEYSLYFMVGPSSIISLLDRMTNDQFWGVEE